VAVRYERVKVTKRLARLLLENNVEYNRNPKVKSKVPQYTADMDAGKWDTNNGEVIKISGEIVNGEPTPGTKLIDGQNRMLALKGSKLTHLWLDFAFNVKEQAYDTIDSGAVRTFADVLKKYNAGAERFVNGAVVRRVYLWDTFGNRMMSGGGSPIKRPSKPLLLEFWSKDTGGFDAASRRGADAAKAGIGQASIAGAAFYLFARIDKDAANAFFDMVLTGANLPPGHPALFLARKLTKDKDYLNPDEQMILWIKAWNMYRKDEIVDRTITTLGFRGRPYNDETFPTPE
jgi:hypothetical protein